MGKTAREVKRGTG
uniref:Uncharacterized protein n=1 Tax=Arundo donax TaxID=35708 RepID=A0A0A9AW70_ARUDO